VVDQPGDVLDVRIDGGKAGILIELSAQTGKLIWKLPVGVHNGHDNDGLLTENAKPTSHVKLPKHAALTRADLEAAQP